MGGEDDDEDEGDNVRATEDDDEEEDDKTKDDDDAEEDEDDEASQQEQDHDAKPASPTDCPTELNKNTKRGDTKVELLNQKCYQVGDEVRIGTEVQKITAIDTETTFGAG